MKVKTIKKILDKKFDHLVDSIQDDEIKKIVADNTIITGGCIVSMLLGEDVNDYDLYFRTKEATKRIATFYIEQFKSTNTDLKFKTQDSVTVPLSVIEEAERIKIVYKSVGIASESQEEKYQYFEGVEPGAPDTDRFVDSATVVLKELFQKEKPAYRPIFLTSNAITLANNIQLIIRFYGEPDVIHENYDFVHCTNYWTSWDKEIVLRKKALETILTKELVYSGSKYPICSMFRTRKFIKRGWSITAGQMLKIAYQINELDLKDMGVLEDQLLGVDVAYFHELLSILKKDNKKDIDSAYISKIVDEVF